MIRFFIAANHDLTHEYENCNYLHPCTYVMVASFLNNGYELTKKVHIQVQEKLVILNWSRDNVVPLQ